MHRRQVFSELFSSYYALIVRYVERRVWNRAIAEELAAETFEVAWQKLDPDEPQGLPWLYRIASFKVSNHRVREANRIDADIALHRAASEPSEQGDRAQSLDVRRAIAALPDREREAIALTYWEGLSAPEAAEVLDCSVAAVWKLLSRARAKLKDALADDDRHEGRPRMPLSDDELDRLIRSADPARTPPYADRSAIAVRDRIMASATAVGTPRAVTWRRTVWMRAMVAAAAVAALVLTVVLVTPFGRPTASALTPPPLPYASTGETLDDVVERADASLLSSADSGVPRRGATSLGWYFDIAQSDAGVEVVPIAPEITDLTWEDDLSGSLTVTAAERYWSDGSEAPTDDAPASGAVLSHELFAPGEAPVAVVTPPGEDRESVLEALRTAGLPEDYSAADLLTAVDALFFAWTLTDRQQSILLHLLLDADGAVVQGSAEDREGRPVVGVSAKTDGIHELTLLVSTETGRITGLETSLTEPYEVLDVGSVISYVVWDVPS